MTSAKFSGFWTPSPPFVTHSRNLSVVFVTYWETPLPPQCGRHLSIAPYGCSLNLCRLWAYWNTENEVKENCFLFTKPYGPPNASVCKWQFTYQRWCAEKWMQTHPSWRSSHTNAGKPEIRKWIGLSSLWCVSRFSSLLTIVIGRNYSLALQDWSSVEFREEQSCLRTMLRQWIQFNMWLDIEISNVMNIKV